MQRVIEVSTGGDTGYPVLCGRGAGPALASLWQPRWRQAVLIGDHTTARLYFEPLEKALQAGGPEVVLPLSFPAGERHKTRTTWAKLTDAMAERGIDRSGCVVGVGGGVALDMAGFVASTYMRGVPHINVATSLLAQVDAAIGGKTGVDTRHGKNLVGAFHHPRAVLLDAGALETLPPRELRNGLAEVLKHALVADAALFAELEQWAASGEKLPPEAVVARCVQIKARVVEADPRDTGQRQILNFGHTAGHAIEAATGHRVPHGRAVAMGMLIEARIATRLCGFGQDEVERLQALTRRLGLPVRAVCGFEAARPFLTRDKKAEAGSVRCALPLHIGQMDPAQGRWVRDVPLSLLQDAWGEVEA